jgi:signal transduction histidine kinase
LPEVLIDASFTQQVFVNLLANARDALSSLPEGLPRRLDIDLGADTEAVVYRIRNCGPVISADDRARIFDAFFTTKGADTGTGLGLALSRDVIQRQGGAIELSPDPVTCFIVRLPTVESSRSG